jgi:putative ABC transport system substrate-binding protein
MKGLRLAVAIPLLLAGLLSPVAAGAQTVKVSRIGYLSPNLTADPHLPEAFRQGLRDLGYVEGRNLVIEYRDAAGKHERLPALAAELVALKVDVIVAANTPSALAAKRATSTLPIAFAAVGDPVTSGLVSSLARPGGNATGTSGGAPELVSKCLEQLKQAVPGVSRVAVLWQPGAFGERTERDMLKRAEVAARALGLRAQFVEARDSADLDRAFSEMTKARADGLTVLTSAMFISQRRRVVDLAAQNRLPAVYAWREFIDAGGLMAYGPNLADLFQRAATYVDKILKGTKPADTAGRAADEVRAGHQPQGRQAPWPNDPAVGAGSGRPGDREMSNIHRGGGSTLTLTPSMRWKSAEES